MPRRLIFAIFLSGFFHLSLLAVLLLWTADYWRNPRRFLEAGGVVWFNLLPGGEGSGGEGGLGPPKKKSAESKKAQVPRSPSGLVQAKPTPKILEASLPPQDKFPGEGDFGGTKTGPGLGEGRGLGNGLGSGAGSGAGPGGVGPLGTGGAGTGGTADSVLAQIRQKILRAKRYPRQARAEGIEGICGLNFELNPDGSLRLVDLTRSSGSEILDEEALATVRRAAPFPYYAGPIRFNLRFSLKETPDNRP